MNNDQFFIDEIKKYFKSHQITCSSLFQPNYEPHSMFIKWIVRISRPNPACLNSQEFKIEQNLSVLPAYHHGSDLSRGQILQQILTRKMAIKYGLEIIHFNNDGNNDVKRLTVPSYPHIIMRLLTKSRSIHANNFSEWALNNCYSVFDKTARSIYNDHCESAIKFNSLFSMEEKHELNEILTNY
jgi:hypothetical protein